MILLFIQSILFFSIAEEVYHFLKHSPWISWWTGYKDKSQEPWFGVYLKALREKGINTFSHPCPRKDMLLTDTLQLELVRWNLAVSNGRYFENHFLLLYTSLAQFSICPKELAVEARPKPRLSGFYVSELVAKEQRGGHVNPVTEGPTPEVWSSRCWMPSSHLSFFSKASWTRVTSRYTLHPCPRVPKLPSCTGQLLSLEKGSG